jgi:leucyl/phenylalanyl-tRNA---protein transferase
MPIFRLPRLPHFPDPELADPEGLLAVGGDLSPRRLLSAYGCGIFPWYEQGSPLLWWSPPERAIWLAGDFVPSHSLRKVLRRGRYELRIDTAFAEVIHACATTPRDGQPGTWITDEMRAAYTKLHQLGFAHSFESWCGGELMGGLYGLSLGAAFFGESMFSRATDASKAAFAGLAEHCFGRGFELIDGQLRNPHLLRLGARMVPRPEFLQRLQHALEAPTRQGSWSQVTAPRAV